MKLALRIFNLSTVSALRASRLQHATGTAEYINMILTWWNVVNVKTPNKGQRLRDDLQRPVTSTSCSQLLALKSRLQWLDYWGSLVHDAGHLTRETRTALCHTTHALHEIAVYCLEELGMQYVILGKFQTDCLEDRFGKYRQLCGSQYHVSIRQIYESEKKLRLQNVLEFPGLDVVTCDVAHMSADSLKTQFDITVTDSDIEKKSSRLPAVTYVAGYCAHAALKKLLCASCRDNLVIEGAEVGIEENALIASMTRGGLKFPQAVVVNAVLVTEIVLDKLRSPQFSAQFLSLPKQKEALVALVSAVLDDVEDLDVCDYGHTPHEVMHIVLSAATNTMLNNLCKVENNKLIAKKGKRKLETVKA